MLRRVVREEHPVVRRHGSPEHHPMLLLLRRCRHFHGEALLLSAALDGQRNFRQPRLRVPVGGRLGCLVIACEILCRSLCLRAARDERGGSGSG
jgi:hypothetical protein